MQLSVKATILTRTVQSLFMMNAYITGALWWMKLNYGGNVLSLYMPHYVKTGCHPRNWKYIMYSTVVRQSQRTKPWPQLRCTENFIKFGYHFWDVMSVDRQNIQTHRNALHLSRDETFFSTLAGDTDLPQFHLYSTVQLDEPRLQVQMLAVGIIDVDCTLLVLMLVDVTEMSSQLSAAVKHKQVSKKWSVKICIVLYIW